MFERLHHTSVEVLCGNGQTLTCLVDMGSWAYDDNLALYEFIQCRMRSGRYVSNIKNTHARLARRCVMLNNVM